MENYATFFREIQMLFWEKVSTENLFELFFELQQIGHNHFNVRFLLFGILCVCANFHANIQKKQFKILLWVCLAIGPHCLHKTTYLKIFSWPWCLCLWDAHSLVYQTAALATIWNFWMSTVSFYRIGNYAAKQIKSARFFFHTNSVYLKASTGIKNLNIFGERRMRLWITKWTFY